MTDAARVLARELRISEELCVATLPGKWIELSTGAKWRQANPTLDRDPRLTMGEPRMVHSDTNLGHG
jgi:hypothetical protein